MYHSVFDCASPQALAAVRATKNWRRWGYMAATKAMLNAKVPPLMFAMVCEFEVRRQSKSTKVK
jgi:hypothetical protein